MKRQAHDWEALFDTPDWSATPVTERQRQLLAAQDFLEFLQQRGGEADADAVHAWLLARLASRTVYSTRADLYALRRMLRGDAVQQWIRCHSRILDTLKALHAQIPREPYTEPGGPVTVHLEAFLCWRKSLQRGDRDRHALRRLDRYLIGRGLTTLEAIDAAVLRDFLATRRVSRPTLAIEIRGIRNFFVWLRRTGQFEGQPEASLLPQGPLPRHRPYIFTLKEIVELLEWVRGLGGWQSLTAFTALYLIYASGLRISEALRLDLSDVDLQLQTLHIRKTKFGKTRQIPLGARAREHLAVYRDERIKKSSSTDRFFITAQGRNVPYLWLRDLFRRACIGTGLAADGIWRRVHDLRHTFAVHRLYKWYLDGVDPQTKLCLLSIYMGHVAVHCTAHYLQMGADLMRTASSSCARTLDETLEQWRRRDH